jgi:hypothetical protein
MQQLVREARKVRRHRFVYWFLFSIALTTWCFWPTHGQSFTTGKPAPDISGGPWLNTKPLTISDLKGRVVVVEFWTYG